MSDVLLESTLQDGSHHSWLFFCPGCRCAHPIDDRWTFDGNMSAPTFSPSLLVNGHGHGMRCHSFIRAGSIQFLGDCDHELAGQTVPMEAFRWDDEGGDESADA